MYENKHFSPGFPAIIFLITAVLAFGSLTDPPQGPFYEQYFSIYLGKVKCGCAHFQNERTGERIITRSKMIINIGRNNRKFQIKQFTKTTETIDGKPISYKSESELAGAKTIYDGQFQAGVVTLKITRNSQSATHKFTIPDDAKLPWGSYLKTLPYLNQTGATCTVNTYDPQINLQKPVRIKFDMAGHTTIRVDGKRVSGMRVISKIENLGQVDASSILDKDGFPLFTETSIGPFKLVLIAAAKAAALSNLKTKEIFQTSLIKLDHPLKLNSSCLTLKLSPIGNFDLPPLPDTNMQKVTYRSVDYLIVKICSGGIKNGQPQKPPSRETLASTSYVRLNDPLLIKLANEAVSEGANPATAVRELCSFVHKYIGTKNLSSIFDTASRVARTRTGDCSEHSVLFAALARIRKIPARVVTGLVYTKMAGKYGAFGYHMWDQVWIDGRWIDTDPTFGEFHCDQTHLALATSDLTEANFTSDNLKLAKFIGKIKIEVMDK